MASSNERDDRGTSEPARGEAASARVELVPDQLWARVYLHEIASQHGTVQCWSYVTEGLAALRQTEIVFTLRRDPREPSDQVPNEPFQLFATIHQLAESGQRVTSGSFTELGAGGFFGHHLLYVEAQPIAGVTLPSQCLTAVLVTADELRAVREFGSTRVLARLGQAASHYPFPPWSDRRRRGLSLERTLEASLLSRVARASAHDAHVGLHDQQITLAVVRSEQGSWKDRLAQIPETVPLALLTAFDPAANGCLVWVPGQKAPEAIIPPGSDGSRVCGCFVVFVAEQASCGGKLLEDGFAIELTSEAWRQIRRALIDGKELALPAAGDRMGFALTWRDEVYVSPIDAQAYRAEGGWTTTQPAAPASRAGDADAARTPARLTLGQLRLLMSQDDFAARTSAGDLAVFCREIQRCAERVLADHDGELEILLQLRCRPDGHEVGLSHRGDASAELTQALLDEINGLVRLPVQGGEVRFELQLALAGYAPRSAI
jgi:hypothetical protein